MTAFSESVLHKIPVDIFSSFFSCSSCSRKKAGGEASISILTPFQLSSMCFELCKSEEPKGKNDIKAMFEKKKETEIR